MDTQAIFEEVAQKYGVTAEEVRGAIEDVICAAWTDPNRTESERKMQEKISQKGKLPSPEDVIRFVALMANMRMLQEINKTV